MPIMTQPWARRSACCTGPGTSTTNANSTFKGDPLPRTASHVHVELNTGRGTVEVAQQPNADNGYTAIIRVSDAPPGYGFYDFDVRWY
jgi:hypothetical protein